MSIFDVKAGTELTIIFQALDFAGNFVSGVTDHVATLRDEDGAASEAVAVDEQGTSGFYEARITPTKSAAQGFNYFLRLKMGTGTNGAISQDIIRSFPSISVSAVTGSFLTTLANLKEYGEISGTAQDALLTNLIARVSRLIEARIDEKIVSTIYQEILDAPHHEVLQLRHAPLDPPVKATVTAVYVSRDQTWDASTLVAAADYLVDPIDAEIFRKGTVWRRGFQNVRVDYTAGYSSIPLDIEQLAIEITLRTYKSRKNIEVSSQSLKDGSITKFMAGRFGKEIRAELAPYRRTRVVV